jgi:hypothetical protein
VPSRLARQRLWAEPSLGNEVVGKVSLEERTCENHRRPPVPICAGSKSVPASCSNSGVCNREHWLGTHALVFTISLMDTTGR